MFAIMARGFQFVVFLSDALKKTRYMFTSRPSSCSFYGYFSIQHFLLCSLVSIFFPKFFCFAFGCWFVFVQSPPTCWSNVFRFFLFFFFGMSCFVGICWPYFGISFTNIFWFVSYRRVVVLVYACLFGLFPPFNFLFVLPSLAFLLIVAVSLFVLLASFPIQVLYFI